jgi:hypothetical protein
MLTHYGLALRRRHRATDCTVRPIPLSAALSGGAADGGGRYHTGESLQQTGLAQARVTMQREHPEK